MPSYLQFIFRFTLFALLHSIFATEWVKAIFARLFGGATPSWYRLIYNLISIALFFWVMSTFNVSKVFYHLQGFLSFVMYLAQILIAVLLLDCLRKTGLADFLGFRHQPVIKNVVVSGYYSIVRHPLYLLAIFFMLLNPVMTLKWALLTIISVIYFVVGAFIEERRLVMEFGDKYLDYQKRVPFIIPKIY